jgi:hypothetical protein
LLVSWCAGSRRDIADNDEDHDRSTIRGAEDRGWSNTCQVLGRWTIRRLGDTICGLYCAHRDEEHGFLG